MHSNKDLKLIYTKILIFPHILKYKNIKKNYPINKIQSDSHKIQKYSSL